MAGILGGKMCSQIILPFADLSSVSKGAAISSFIRSFYYESRGGKTFWIEKTKPEKTKEFVEFMYSNYIPQNQLCTGLGISPTDPSIRLLTERRVKKWVSSGTSCYAADVATGELAAVSFCQVITPENRNVYGEDLENLSPQVLKMQKIFAILENSVDVFEDANVWKALEMAAIGIKSEYAGNNLQSVLTEENWRLGKDMGCDASIFHSTNILTQNVLRRVASLRFTLDLEHLIIDGEKVMNLVAMNGTHSVQVFVKDLRDISIR